jgi:hypothetical protein
MKTVQLTSMICSSGTRELFEVADGQEDIALLEGVEDSFR